MPSSYCRKSVRGRFEAAYGEGCRLLALVKAFLAILVGYFTRALLAAPGWACRNYRRASSARKYFTGMA